MTVDVNKDYNDPILAEDDGTLRVKGWNSDGDCDILPGSLIGKTKFIIPGGTVARSNEEREKYRIDVIDDGADPTGVADSTAAFNAAIIRANAFSGADGGARVTVPAGTFKISGKLILPKGVWIVGQGRRATKIIAAESWNVASHTHMVRFGDNSPAFGFDNYLESLTLDANNVASLSCLDAYRSQEGCGARFLSLMNFTGVGLDASSGDAANFFAYDIECYPSSSGSTGGMNISASNFMLNKATVVALKETGPANTGYGIRILDTTGYLSGIHVENVTNGLQIDGNNSSCVVDMIDATGGNFAVTNLVKYAGGSVLSSLRGVMKGNATHAITNDLTGSSIDDTFIPDGSSITRMTIPVSSPTVSGSPFEYRNNTSTSVVLFIAGGTVSAVSVERYVGASAGTVSLPASTPFVVLSPGMRCFVSYSDAPTITVFPL